MSHQVLRTVAAKRDGAELSVEQIGEMIAGYAADEVPDYQMAAFAMAVFLNGMTPAEIAALTDVMLHSGEILDWPAGSPVVDKHSTGGIGDKVSLILAPMLAACGLRVPMISGRGLGPTGGTLDKLEAIPGFRTDLSVDEIRRVVETVGCCITGAGPRIAPADRKLYALRDVTATVPSIPLITASIMSKKLAEGLDSLVLDVKVGAGAFMKTLDQARLLAKSLADVGNRLGVNTRYVITDMNQPLGRLIGNGVEVDESLAALQGVGPSDLMEVTCRLGAELLVASQIDPGFEAAERRLRETVASGAALERFERMVSAQGGDLAARRPRGETIELPVPCAGYVQAIDNEQLGWTVIELGGGRKQLTDPIDHSVGLEILVRIGDAVERGVPWIRVFGSRDASRTHAASSLLKNGITISPLPVVSPPVIVESQPET